MKTVLICHEEDVLNRQAVAAWLGSFTELVGIIAIEETAKQKKARFRREWKRLGSLRFLDVVAFRIHHRIFHQRRAQQYEQTVIQHCLQKYSASKSQPEVIRVATPNAPEAQAALKRWSADLILARCKVLLKPEIFEQARCGTYVLHPGICPEYRNAHGCFWALARRDLTRVGSTLLRIDRGIDTGPVFAYYHCTFDQEMDESKDSHFSFQTRSVFENLPAIEEKLLQIGRGQAVPLNTQGRESRNWGQPWLTRYFRWRWLARQGRKFGGHWGVLLYHDVCDDFSKSGFSGADADLYKMKRDSFIRHLDAIKKHVPYISTISSQRDPMPDDRVMLTFDDGGESAHSVIAPLLEERGWRGLFFIVPNRIGQPGFLRPEQVADLHRRGHVIGSHSWSHPPRLSHLSEEQIFSEWHESKKALEQMIGVPVLTASVPGGFYSKEVARLAQKAGYEILFNSEPSTEPHQMGSLLIVGRFGLQGPSPATMAVQLATGQGWARRRQFLFWNIKKLLKLIGGSVWLYVRRQILHFRKS